MASVREQSYELVSVDEVQAHPDNPRRGQVAPIEASIERNQFYGALLVQRSTGFILAGNHRWLAAKQAGLEKLPVIFVDCDVDEARRILVADNRTSDLGGYDNDELVRILQGLGDLDGTGYSEADLLELLGGKPADAFADPDAVPVKPAKPVTVAGDVWLCGPHRVMCGSSADPVVVERLMAGVVADLVWTDPPYGVSYVGKTADALTIDNDELGLVALEALLRDALGNALVSTRPGACWYVAAPSGPQFLPFAKVLTELAVWRQTIVWVKDVLVMGRSDYHYRHEAIFYGWSPGDAGERPPGVNVPDELLRGEHYDEAADALLYGWTPGAAHQRPPNRKQETVWEVDRPKASREHPTMKPVELILRAIRNSTNIGDVVLDVFGGSGSTMVAAHQCGRVARLVELDPCYVDVICRRWQEGTGVLPISVATGRAHDFVASATSPRTASERSAGSSPKPARSPSKSAPRRGGAGRNA